ncbi:MAG TPA: prepilin-type N-terminal cleavage/methylation domain-containing protein [Candidatus Didemnitutus sp.]|nr:prepilin-type N-terminal cleavage/methylation domain-containing protein [Candidatus Didemnitutus sp.]
MARPLVRGFTLVEILLVLALLAIFSTLLLPGVNSMLRAVNSRAPEQIVAETILAARSGALESGRTVELRFDSELRQLSWTGPTGHIETLPAGQKLELLPPEYGPTALLGGQVVEMTSLRRIRFFPDGTCDPFRVRLQFEKSMPALFVVDPWTCALSPAPAKS